MSTFLLLKENSSGLPEKTAVKDYIFYLLQSVKYALKYSSLKLGGGEGEKIAFKISFKIDFLD